MVSLRRCNEQELAVLVAAQHDPRADLKIIAKRARCSIDTVRRSILRLTERGILSGVTPLVNLNPLGFLDVQVYFSWNPEVLDKQEQIVQFFVQDSRVAWVASLSGEYDAALLIPSAGPDTACELLEHAGKRFGGFCSKRSIVIRRSFTAYGRRHLAPTSIPPRPFAIESSLPRVEVDNTDRAILSLYSRGEGLSARVAARTLGTSHSTIERRLRSLEDRKIIPGWIYRVNPANLGILTARVFLSLGTTSPNVRSIIRNFCNENLRVIKLFENLGPWDYELEIDGYSLEEIERLKSSIVRKVGSSLIRVSHAQLVRQWKYQGFPFDP